MITVEARSLVFGYKTPLFTPLDFYCGTGDITAILGSNGRGKTTLLHTFMGLVPVLSGRLTLAERIGFVPQSFTPHFDYTVQDMVLMGRVSAIKLLALPSKEDETSAFDALKRLGMSELADHPYHTLSGGQRQLVLIARALGIKSKTLMLDEPTNALDLQNQGMVLQLLKQLAKQEGMNILFTTHDPNHALLIADNTLLFMPDKRWLFGKTRDILTEDHLMTAYGVTIQYASSPEGPLMVIPIFDL